MKVIAIYHRKTRKVLGYVDRERIEHQTGGYRNHYAIMLRLIFGQTTKYEYRVKHDMKGNPTGVIAYGQRDTDLLIRVAGGYRKCKK